MVTARIVAGWNGNVLAVTNFPTLMRERLAGTVPESIPGSLLLLLIAFMLLVLMPELSPAYLLL
jgi:hypothetical protein